MIYKKKENDTLAVLRAAPYPVDIPHPSKHTFSSGADGLTCNRHN
jgi:hypothetical protein